jgi:hypothetical protein
MPTKTMSFIWFIIQYPNEVQNNQLLYILKYPVKGNDFAPEKQISKRRVLSSEI